MKGVCGICCNQEQLDCYNRCMRQWIDSGHADISEKEYTDLLEKKNTNEMSNEVSSTLLGMRTGIISWVFREENAKNKAGFNEIFLPLNLDRDVKKIVALRARMYVKKSGRWFNHTRKSHAAEWLPILLVLASSIYNYSNTKIFKNKDQDTETPYGSEILFAGVLTVCKMLQKTCLLPSAEKVSTLTTSINSIDAFFKEIQPFILKHYNKITHSFEFCPSCQAPTFLEIQASRHEALNLKGNSAKAASESSKAEGDATKAASRRGEEKGNATNVGNRIGGIFFKPSSASRAVMPAPPNALPNATDGPD